MLVVNDLSGAGGAERLFSDLHEYLAREGLREAYLITSTVALQRLQAAGRLRPARRVITLNLGEHVARGAVRLAWTTVCLLWTTIVGRFDVIHVCLPTPTYVPLLALLSRLPAFMRPKLALTVIDCTLAQSLQNASPEGGYERQVLDAHQLYFRWTRLDGIFSWYRSIVSLFERRCVTPTPAVVRAAKYCFTNPDHFRPGIKERLVVFAGRLSEQKRPVLFVDAVARLVRRDPEIAECWRFEMYGTGMLEHVVRARITSTGLENVVSLSHAVDMAPVFARSRLFVSTQAIENFTSLAMLEAMAAGNAVIAENVGQTCEFVRHGDNGLLVYAGTADAFASAIHEYISRPEKYDEMAAASRRLATEVHTIERFAADIGAFWDAVA
jgi:glycosyltransferase involved in cell wall biosynthesis